MERIAIIDHDTHELWIEDISDEDLEKVNGEEETYIKQNYPTLENYSWDFITGIAYLQEEDKDPIAIDELKEAFV